MAPGGGRDPGFHSRVKGGRPAALKPHPIGRVKVV